MDLLGLDLVERRKEAKFTVLKRPGGRWQDWEQDRLSLCLKPMAVVATHPRHPEFLVIANEYLRDDIIRALQNSNFEYQVLQGWNNPDLPFRAEL